MDKDITGLLRKSGYRVTPQRLAVYDALARTKEHPNAETLYASLLPAFPTMSLATVYKTVEILHNIGLIRLLNTGEPSFRYDADVSEHAHVQCESCGAVLDAFSVDVDNIIKAVEEETGCLISRKQLYFYGLCPLCRKNGAN
jgi:Fur family peroxide stress response transcriptional regulator